MTKLFASTSFHNISYIVEICKSPKQPPASGIFQLVTRLSCFFQADINGTHSEHSDVKVTPVPFVPFAVWQGGGG